MRLAQPKFIITFVALAWLIPACASAPAKSEPPAWLTQLIAEYQANPVTNPPRTLWRYQYAGATVYFTPPVCCDIPSQVFAQDGKTICFADGGFTGGGDGRCVDFHATKREEALVWKDGRGLSGVK